MPLGLLRFVHAADLHLDSPFTGIRNTAPENVSQALYDATFKTYDNLIDLCIDEGVDALLVAGDIYDSADRSLRAQYKFIAGLERLSTAGIRSFVCHGNHDPLDGWEARLTYPEGCHRFGSTFEAASVFPDDPNRAIVYGISYPTRDVYDNLILGLGQVEPDPFSIGLLHANVGNNTGHAAYAPCSLADLENTGIDYWALGHVHTRQTLSEQHPTVVYPGNTQGRHANETGARGAYIVEVDETRRVQLTFHELDLVRWARLQIDISNFQTEQELMDVLHDSVKKTLTEANGRNVVYRLTLTGRSELNHSLRNQKTVSDIDKILEEVWTQRSPFAWCERIEVTTASPFDREALVAGSDFLAEALKTSGEALTNPELASKLREALSDLYRHQIALRWDLEAPTDEEFTAIVADAEAMVMDLLSEVDA